VPEIASRFHLEYINPVLKEALKTARVKIKDIELIAVTKEPGLVGSLLTGISMARALEFALSVPLIEVNHIIAHIYANLLSSKDVSFPLVGLVVSGGHTSLIWMEDIDKYTIMGRTQDDAAGEAFDKVAKILRLGYPGGPIIEERARSGDPAKIRFPRSSLKKGALDFSFSGIKTAVLYHVKKLNTQTLDDQTINDICVAFQDAVCDMITEKAILACVKRGSRSLVVGGGVSANKALRNHLTNKANELNIDVKVPPIKLCIDNAAMVGGLGEALYKKRLHN